jgi:hypothetical protein
MGHSKGYSQYGYSKMLDKEWFLREYPYIIEVDPKKGYSYYIKIIHHMEIERPLWNRFIERPFLHKEDKDREFFGFKESSHAVFFRLGIE